MPGEKKRKTMSKEEAEEVSNRLHSSLTEAKSGKAGQQPMAEDKISKGPKSEEEIKQIINRLYESKTKSMMSEGGGSTEETPRKTVTEQDLSYIIDRLYTTQTKASVGCHPDIKYTEDMISKGKPSGEEVVGISARLSSTHTKASSGATQCKPYEENKTPGYGNKTFPVVEGIEERFRGHEVPPAKVDEVIAKLHTTLTKSGQARRDPPRILLYPERTTLMNNVERIVNFQNSGYVSRQKELQRREKWFN